MAKKEQPIPPTKEKDNTRRNTYIRRAIIWFIVLAIIAGLAVGLYFLLAGGPGAIPFSTANVTGVSVSKVEFGYGDGRTWLVYVNVPRYGAGTVPLSWTTDANGAFHYWAGARELVASDPLYGAFDLFRRDHYPVAPTDNTRWVELIVSLIPYILFFGFIIYMISRASRSARAAGSGEQESGGGFFLDPTAGMGRSQAKLAKSKVKFDNVAGIEEEKAELIEVVDYLKRPAKYAAMGARIPRGVILYGPPGTGKTLLAKAVAGEAGVPFYQISGSAFEEMLVGVGAKRVRSLFANAKKTAPCIVFIDEIDTVGSKRGRGEGSGSAAMDQTLNQLLAEMDGFETSQGVIVMAATNRLDVLDEALLRPGRFDRHIQVNLPDLRERTAILRLHAKNKNISGKVNLEDIARRTPGFSGAQLENVLNEATLLAVRDDHNVISIENLDEAIDRVIAGPAKKSRLITPEEKEQIAYHEAGHALVGLYMPGSDIVQKITIIPRGQAGGYTLMTPEKQELQITKKSELLSNISTSLGGRASEELKYGPENVSSGAANDLYRVTAICRAMVMQLGMSSLGMTQYVPSEGARSPFAAKLYSEKTSENIDVEIDKIIRIQYETAKDVLSKNKKELDLIVETLLLLETIVRDDIDFIHKNKKLPANAVAKKQELAQRAKEAKEKADAPKAKEKVEPPKENEDPNKGSTAPAVPAS